MSHQGEVEFCEWLSDLWLTNNELVPFGIVCAGSHIFCEIMGAFAMSDLKDSISQPFCLSYSS